jgi:uncharacterized membrane protein HdeD (DUF308 family)
MNPKFYDKAWLQAFKGGFFIILGIIAMSRVPGSIKSLAMFFAFFIGMTGFVLIVGPILLKKSENRIWNILSGVINVVFAFILIFIADYPGTQIIWALLGWVVYNAVSEIVEAVILYNQKNAFAAIFMIHALLSLLFGYGLYILTYDFTAEKVFNIGLIALVFGLVNELSAFMLNSIKKPE